MKISEFAQKNNVTAKMLRHYDAIGLLCPESIDESTGYRDYSENQGLTLSWILILKSLDFSLNEIRSLLSGSVQVDQVIEQLINKRIQISKRYNDQVLKRIQIDRLIQLIEQEGFSMEKQVTLTDLTAEGIHEIKKYMPNMELFLENVHIAARSAATKDHFAILRLDLCQFKAVNDIDGYDVGDKVIVSFYKAIQDAIEPIKDRTSLGRAGGDEFLLFLVGTPDIFDAIGKLIIKNMKSTDFASLGCHKQVPVYISGIQAPMAHIQKLRNIMDLTFETQIVGKKLGAYSILIEDYR